MQKKCVERYCELAKKKKRLVKPNDTIIDEEYKKMFESRMSAGATEKY